MTHEPISDAFLDKLRKIADKDEHGEWDAITVLAYLPRLLDEIATLRKGQSEWRFNQGDMDLKFAQGIQVGRGQAAAVCDARVESYQRVYRMYYEQGIRVAEAVNCADAIRALP